jgi:hypothetical protein
VVVGSPARKKCTTRMQVEGGAKGMGCPARGYCRVRGYCRGGSVESGGTVESRRIRSMRAFGPKLKSKVMR